jgi:asparagine synthase (glutamine-hydrolysing)
MCGIIGTTNISIEDKLFDLGLDQINRRGPDSSTVKSNNYVKFGHTRLSILDLDSRSNQPFEYNILSKSKNILITFNGEIYNYLIIKKDLQLKGYKFKTESDTEVICAAYCEYGLNCFDYFEGMWAIIINDDSKLIISRDRVGKKPLYYCHLENNIYFGSSIKSVSIISHQKSLSPEAIELYFALGFIPKNYTIYQDIQKIEPGYIQYYEKVNDVFILKQESKSTFNNKFTVKSKNIKDLINHAVEKRLIADVPVTTLMSGGIDSSIISSLIYKYRPRSEAYFVDFNDRAFSEKKWAHYLARRNNIKLNTVVLNSEDLSKAFLDYYSAYDEPFADYGGIPSLAIFGEVSRKFRVVLTGDGGDELFYGYPHYFKKFIIYNYFIFLKIFVKIPFMPENLKSILTNKKVDFESNYLRNHGIVTNFAAQIINSNFNRIILESKSFIKGMIAYDREFYNWPEKYLVKLDRASMFYGVEVRSPFMDENLKKAIIVKSPLKLFTPFMTKLYLKIKFFRIFGFGYFFAKKRGFTPPIQELRNKYFRESDFLNLKDFLKLVCPRLYLEIVDINFTDIEKDKILFDRFFFFNQWRVHFQNYS